MGSVGRISVETLPLRGTGRNSRQIPEYLSTYFWQPLVVMLEHTACSTAVIRVSGSGQLILKR